MGLSWDSVRTRASDETAGSEAGRFRVLVVGTHRTLASAIPFDQLADFKLEFASPAALGEPELRSQAAGFDAVLVDSRGVAEHERSDLVRDLLAHLVNYFTALCPIVIVDSEDVETAILAAGDGAWDVLRSDAEEGELAACLRRAARLSRLRAKRGADSVDEPVQTESQDDSRQMIGTSPEIRGVFSLIRKVAATDVPVLITGESGAGKELTALAIHQRSLRRECPFVPINCSAIPVDLLESELFGHERGAFTGATTLRRGRLEAANGGTLFLDEIGDLAPTAQVKLLRFLEDHVVERVGGSRRIPLDVRVVAATHRNLLEAIETGEFREDLYYRLAVFTIKMPALRDRGEDSLLIARVLLDGYARQAGKPITGFSRAALDTMRRHAWPGNVRELINRLRRAVTVAEGANLTPSDLGFEGVEPMVPACSLREARLRAEREAMGRALEQAGGNRSEAARMLGISRTQLYELMRRQPREL